MTLMSFSIPLGRSGARVTLHNVGIRLRLCEREVLWLSLARKWMVSFQGASLGWEMGPKASDGTHITVDPGIRRPGLVLTKHLSIPQQGQQTPTHASVLQPHPSGLCRRFGHGPKLLAGPRSAPLAPVLLLSTPELLMALKGNSERYGAENPMGHTMKHLTEQWMTELMSFLACFGELFVWQCFKSKKKRNEMKDLIYSMYYILTPTSLPRSGWLHPSLFKPRRAWNKIFTAVKRYEDQAWLPLPLD